MEKVLAINKEDGDLTSKVKLNGEMNTSKAGTYVLTYTVTDSVGNEVHAIQKVLVKDKDTSKAKGITNNGNIPNSINSDKKNLHIKSFPTRVPVQLTVQQWAYGWLLQVQYSLWLANLERYKNNSMDYFSHNNY